MSEFSWETLVDVIKKNNEVMLLTIIEKKGSAPRGVGTSMLVLPDCHIYGTIGGGPVENELINEAVEYIQNKKTCVVEKFFSGDSAICGGRIKVLMEYYSKNDSEFLDKIMEKYHNGENVYLVRDLSNMKRIIADKDYSEDFNNENYFVQEIKAKPRLFIFGAGHIAIPLVKIANLCEFSIDIFDDRKEFANTERFPEVNNVIVCNFENVLPYITFSNNTFIVLITREHAHDEILLKQILCNSYKYLGVIGSKNRIAAVKKRLTESGFNKGELDNIYSPIGIEINSETPAEIAVSIVAELIKVKNG